MKNSIILIIFIVFCFCADGQELSSAWNKECDCYGFKDSTGKLVIEYKYSSAGKFSEGLANVRLNKKSGFIDRNDKPVIPMIYDWTGSFSEDLAAVKIDGKWGYINKKGTLIIPATIDGDRADEFKDGMAAIRSGKWGYIDKKGKLVIPHIYERADEFRYGLAAVAPVLQQGYGYINKKGEMVIPVQFKYAYPFSDDGTALASTTTRSSIHIDRTGRILEDGDKTTPTPAYKTPPGTQSSSKAAGPEKITYTELEQNNLKAAKEAGNWQAVGFMYIEHGNVEEGTALVKKEIAKGNCEYCESRLAYALFESRFSRTALEACKSASEKLTYAGSANSAIDNLRKFDAQGDMPIASYYLAGGFEKGQIHSSKKEIDSAIHYYQKAAKQGYPAAMFCLGRLYQYANGNDYPTPADRNKYAYLIDKKQARYWYNESAKTGNTWAQLRVTSLDNAAAAAEVSAAYGKGYDAFDANNYEEAYRWWKVAAFEGKNAEAYFGLAILHQLGKAPDNNLNTAMVYYQKAADLGLKDALAEKQKIQDYLDAVAAARQRAATTTSSTASASTQGESYDEWWEKTYGRGGTENSTAMPNNNIPQASYRTGPQSEASRHQQAMDAIQRSIERQQNKDYNYKNR